MPDQGLRTPVFLVIVLSFRMNRSWEQSTEISQELVDMIVDWLAGDYDSLKSCSLVSRKWRPRCRYQLFKVVVFADSLPRQSIASWCATFDHSNGMLPQTVCPL